MSWTQLRFDVPDDLVDVVVGELSADGTAGLWELPSGESGCSQLVFYFRPGLDLDRIERRAAAVFQQAGREPPRMARAVVEDCDWTGEWKKSYTSFPIAESFFVIPSWDNPECPGDRLPIRIDPGQAFGTGTHETTQMTLEALERWIEPRHVVLDVGAGSGILAIASRLLGAQRVFACDIDPVAAQVAKANIERNAEHDVHTFCGSLDAVGSGAFHLILANLTAEVIIELLAEIDRVLCTHGVAILSGILGEQNEAVRDALAQRDFEIFEEITQGEWLALVVEKHGG